MLLLLPATAVLEPSAFKRTHTLMAANPNFVWWLLVNSFMAYAVNLTNFMVTKYTSALTLQVGRCVGVELHVCVRHYARGSRSVLKPRQEGKWEAVAILRQQ